MGSGIKEIVYEISSIIPGFNGYYEKERRREEDKMIRDYISQKIEDIQKRLNDKVKEMTKKKELEKLDKYGSMLKEVERIKDTLKFASYGYKGFFDIVDVDEEGLFHILQIDIEILKSVKEFDAKMIEDVSMLNEFFINFQSLYNKRKEFILGIR